MPFQISEDPNGNTVMVESPLGSGGSEFVVRFADGREAALGAGSADADGLNQTYLRLRNEAGDDRFITIDGTTITSSGTQP